MELPTVERRESFWQRVAALAVPAVGIAGFGIAAAAIAMGVVRGPEAQAFGYLVAACFLGAVVAAVLIHRSKTIDPPDHQTLTGQPGWYRFGPAGGVGGVIGLAGCVVIALLRAPVFIPVVVVAVVLGCLFAVVLHRMHRPPRGSGRSPSLAGEPARVRGVEGEGAGTGVAAGDRAMSNPDRKVECGEHGTREATFVCRHLAAGAKAGFNWGVDPDDPDALWPDAWCDACEEVRQAEGGDWNEHSEGFAKIQLLCDRCYERARGRHWRQDDAAFAKLVTDAATYLRAGQDELQAQFRLGSYERYDWDQETGKLVFSHAGQPQVVASIQFVGSVSTRSNTWLWSWGNRSLLESVKTDVRQVRKYGEEHRYLKLATAYWAAGEADGWEMTAITAYLLRAKGGYRSPDDRGFSFLVMTDVQWAQ